MIEALVGRRDSLKEELARGKELVAKKEIEIKELNQVILRLEGAIQALDEFIEEKRNEGAADSA